MRPTHVLSGYLLFRDFCLKHLEEAKPLVEFYEEVRPGGYWGAGGAWALLSQEQGEEVGASFVESTRCLVLASHVTCGDVVL